MLRDGIRSYGWISIGLHWAVGMVILALLFVGDSIGTDADMLAVHTGLAVTFYALIWLRLLWRLRSGHPGRSPRQGKYASIIGMIIHYALLAALAVMLMSGPPMAWAADIPLRFLGIWTLPSPIGPDPMLHAALLRVHATAATVMAIGIAVHVLAVMKHLLINRDETLARMMVAGEPRVRPVPKRIRAKDDSMSR